MDRHPLVSLLMLLAGMVMLVPGVCVAVIISDYGWPTSSLGPFSVSFFLYFFWPLCFAISAIGVYLLAKVIRDL
jgi:hypothetical protein